MRATMSLEGMLTWYPDIFKNLVLPTKIDRNLVIDEIRLRSFELEVLYPQPEMMSYAIGIWSRLNLPIWERLLETTEYDYNPIHNYDRVETREWSEDRGKIASGTLSDKVDSSGTTFSSRGETDDITEKGTQDVTIDSSGTSHGGGNQTETKTTSKSAYNELDFVDTDRTVTDLENSSDTQTQGTSQETHTDSKTGKTIKDVTENGTVTETNNKLVDEHSTETETVGHTETLSVHGNIGVMSTQDMIMKQREVVLFNVTDVIIEQFIERFFLLVY